MRWLAISRTTVLVLITVQAGAAQAAGDATRGADIFRQNCAMCHSPEPGQNLVGPSLFSVVGRPGLTDEQDRENVVAFLATLRNAAGGGADATTQAKASRSD